MAAGDAAAHCQRGEADAATEATIAGGAHPPVASARDVADTIWGSHAQITGDEQHMSSYTNDYTEQNATAEQALGKVLGGREEPTAPVSDEEARARILSTPVGSDVRYTYETAADACAKLMIETLEADEKVRARIAAAPRDWDRVDLLYDTTNARSDGALSMLGLTGFQVGWAANAAFKLARLETPLRPVKNPAIIEIKIPMAEADEVK